MNPTDNEKREIFMTENDDRNAVVLLGGSGFIGSYLADRLDRGGRDFKIHDIRQSLTGRPTCITDVTKPDMLRAHIGEKSIIVNLAAEHRDDVRPLSRYDAVNVDGARNVCEVAREKGIQRIIFTSTVAVYGFAPPGTDENGNFRPFNDYGRTKAEAEAFYRQWQEEDPENRSLVIIRPTVVFGEGNRGNVYNLLRQMNSGLFMMIGSGKNRKSMAYVENIAAFLEQSLRFGPGIHIYNYVDKPDFDMNSLVREVRRLMGRGQRIRLRIPYALGYLAGRGLDIAGRLTGRTFPVSGVRVKKFCADTTFGTSVKQTGFRPPYTLQKGLERTIRYEFLENHEGPIFYTE